MEYIEFVRRFFAKFGGDVASLSLYIIIIVVITAIVITMISYCCKRIERKMIVGANRRDMTVPDLQRKIDKEKFYLEPDQLELIRNYMKLTDEDQSYIRNEMQEILKVRKRPKKK